MNTCLNVKTVSHSARGSFAPQAWGGVTLIVGLGVCTYREAEFSRVGSCVVGYSHSFGHEVVCHNCGVAHLWSCGCIKRGKGVQECRDKDGWGPQHSAIRIQLTKGRATGLAFAHFTAEKLLVIW